MIPIDQAMSCIGLIFAHQLHPVFGVMFIGVGYPAADLHFFGGRGDWYDLGAAQALLEITQVALQVGQALLVGLIALRRLRGVQGFAVRPTLACSSFRPCGVT